MRGTLKILKLLSDPTRLRILHLLGEEELTVAELQQILGMGQSRTSAHLAQVMAEGLVADRRAGNPRDRPELFRHLLPEERPDLHAQPRPFAGKRPRRLPLAKRRHGQ